MCMDIFYRTILFPKTIQVVAQDQQQNATVNIPGDAEAPISGIKVEDTANNENLKGSIDDGSGNFEDHDRKLSSAQNTYGEDDFMSGNDRKQEDDFGGSAQGGNQGRPV